MPTSLPDEFTVQELTLYERLPIVKSVILDSAPKELVNSYNVEPSTIFGPRIVLTVVVSIKSGTGQAETFYKQALLPTLQFLGVEEKRDYVVHFTASADYVTRLAQTTILDNATRQIHQRVILLSGDGGIQEIINAITVDEKRLKDNPHYVPPQISIIPLGTGNALANSIGVFETDNTYGLSHMLRGSARTLPLMRVEFSPEAVIITHEGKEKIPTYGNFPCIYAAVVCSWGIHAAIVADSDTEEFRKQGAERFTAAAKQNLFPADGSETHTYKAKVSLLRERRESEPAALWQPVERNDHSYVLATLVSQLERGFSISPHSKPLDGVIRLVHWGKMPGSESMRLMMLGMQGGKHVEEEAVNYDAVYGMQIELGGREKSWRYRRICVDGKTVLLGENGFVDCKLSNLRVVDLVCILH